MALQSCNNNFKIFLTQVVADWGEDSEEILDSVDTGEVRVLKIS